MQISEGARVRAVYPDVVPAAIDHVLWCLHRIAPALRRGEACGAASAMLHDIAAYPGHFGDLERLGVARILDALRRGDRLDITAELAQLGWASDGPEPAGTSLFVVLGPLLDARCWARERGINYHRLIPIGAEGDPIRLRGLDPHRIAIIRLIDGAARPPVENALRALRAAGAALLPAAWYPGGTDPGQPRLLLRARPPAPAGA